MFLVENLCVSLQNKEILHNISCTVPSGHITTLLGKSGAGKTTLLKTCAQLIPHTQGNIIAHGRPLQTMNKKERTESIGYVFQDFQLFPHLNVLQNCIDPQQVHGITHKTATTRALHILEELQMSPFINTYPTHLSGGQQQRVAIARALCLQPRILLLDEPTASLDPQNSSILAHILKKLALQGLTVLLSSQDMAFVQTVFDRVYFMHDGKILELCESKEQISSCPHIVKFMGE